MMGGAQNLARGVHFFKILGRSWLSKSPQLRHRILFWGVRGDWRWMGGVRPHTSGLGKGRTCRLVASRPGGTSMEGRTWPCSLAEF